MSATTAFDKPTPVVKLLLTEGAAAEALSISARALWGLRQSGEIPAVLVGRSVRYAVKDLEAWIEKNRATAGPKSDEAQERETDGEPE